MRKNKTITENQISALVKKEANTFPSLLKLEKRDYYTHPLEIIDPNTLSQLKDVVIEEKLITNGKAMRTDYILIPREGIVKIDDSRFGIYPAKARRFDSLIYMCMIDQWNVFFKEKPQRILTNDGSEIYTYKGFPIIESKSDICTKCHTCNERSDAYRFFDEDDVICYGIKYCNEQIGRQSEGAGSRVIRDIRTYKIKPILRTLIEKSNVLMISLEHPCQYQSLDYLLNERNIIDPHNMKIVFPKDFRL